MLGRVGSVGRACLRVSSGCSVASGVGRVSPSRLAPALRGHLRRMCSESSTKQASAEEMAQARKTARKVVLGVSVGLATLVASPVFYYMGNIIATPLPPYVPDAIRGDWTASDGKSSIRISQFNIATVKGLGEGDSPDSVTVQGPVQFGQTDEGGEVTIGFSVGPLVTLLVDTWPERGPDGVWRWEVAGNSYTREE